MLRLAILAAALTAILVVADTVAQIATAPRLGLVVTYCATTKGPCIPCRDADAIAARDWAISCPTPRV